MGPPGPPYIIIGGIPRFPLCRPEKVPPFFPPRPGIIIMGGGGPGGPNPPTGGGPYIGGPIGGPPPPLGPPLGLPGGLLIPIKLPALIFLPPSTLLARPPLMTEPLLGGPRLL